jgi:hypothetical protein
MSDIGIERAESSGHGPTVTAGTSRPLESLTHGLDRTYILGWLLGRYLKYH